MKSIKMEIVKFLLEENINKSNNRNILQGNKNVNPTKNCSKIYRQYF